MKNPLLKKCVLLALIGALLMIPLSMIEHTMLLGTPRSVPEFTLATTYPSMSRK